MTENKHEHSDSVDALHAMAGGEQVAGPPAAKNQRAGAVPAFDAGQLPASHTTPTARRRRNAARATHRRGVHAEQFKRTMIPLLLVVGAMLIVLGAITAFMLPSEDEIELARLTGRSGLLHRPITRWMVVSAFPLGAVLLLGALVFWREIRQKNR